MTTFSVHAGPIFDGMCQMKEGAQPLTSGNVTITPCPSNPNVMSFETPSGIWSGSYSPQNDNFVLFREPGHSRSDSSATTGFVVINAGNGKFLNFNSNPKPKSILTQYEVDCSRRLVRNLKVLGFANNFATGTQLFEQPLSENFRSDEAFVNIVCVKP